MGLLPDKIENLQETVFDFAIGVRFCGGGLNAKDAGAINERAWNSGDRQSAIRLSGLNRAFRHAIERRLRRVLDDDEPAPFLHRFEPLASIGSRARQHDANGALTAILRQRAKEKIESQPRAVTLRWLGKMQLALGDAERDARRNEINMVRLDPGTFGRRRNGHGGVARQKFRHQAGMERIEMLNEDKGHARVRRQRGEQGLESVQPASRCANAYNWKPARRGPAVPSTRSIGATAASLSSGSASRCDGMSISLPPQQGRTRNKNMSYHNHNREYANSYFTAGMSSFRIFEYLALLAKLRLRASTSSCNAIMSHVPAKPFVETNVLIEFETAGRQLRKLSELQESGWQYKAVRIFKGTI